MNELLEDSLQGLHKNGSRHVDLIQSDPCISDYYTQRQFILQQQAQEIAHTVEQIQHKYSTQLWQLEQEYGVYVNMITPVGEHLT
jgi:hypothetical protein